MKTMPEPRAAAMDVAVNAPLPAPERKSPPAVDALQRVVRLALSGVFVPFFEQLPDALQRRASGALPESERLSCAALAKAVASEPSPWVEALLLRVEISLTGSADAVHLASKQVVGGDELLLSPAQLRAETQFVRLIGEFESQLATIGRAALYPIHADALAPASLCRALRDTAVARNYGGAHVRVLLGQFDAIVLPQLSRLYEGLLRSLTDIAARATEAEAMLCQERNRAERLRRTAMAPQPAARQTPPAAPAQRAHPETVAIVSAPPQANDPGSAPSPQPAPATIDEKTAAMLRTVSERTAQLGDVHGDGLLASDLLALQSGTPLPSGIDMPPERRQVPLQRIALAGQFLNEAIEDPFVPEELGPQHESVRFPLVKSALSDATLFTAVTHPLRSLVNELMLKSATSRISGTTEARHMAAVLQQVLVQFDLAPDFVREAMLNAEPISDQQINTFFASQREQAQRRREAVVHEAKRLVVRELELRTFGRGIPQPALRFLNTCWGPLLVKRLLQYGADHEHWREGLDLLEQLLDLIEERANGPAPDAWQILLGKMSEVLSAAKLSAERIAQAMSLLETAWRTPRKPLSL